MRHGIDEPACRIVAVDASRAMIERCREALAEDDRSNGPETQVDVVEANRAIQDGVAVDGTGSKSESRRRPGHRALERSGVGEGDAVDLCGGQGAGGDGREIEPGGPELVADADEGGEANGGIGVVARGGVARGRPIRMD